MSWTNRFGSWSGRFSPFGRGDSSNKEVSDADFSYITNEDLAASQKNLGAAPNSNSSSTDDLAANETSRTRGQNNHAHSGAPGRDNANGDTDVVVFKHKRVSYPVHFPRGSIDDDSLSIRGMREAAARKMGVDDPRRIKLFYKGRQLEDDRAAVYYGLRSDLESEVMCVVGEKPSSTRNHHNAKSSTTTGSDQHTRSSNSYSDDEASSADDDSYRSSTPGADAQTQSKRSGKKRNRRGGRKHNKGARATSEVPQPPTNQHAGGYTGGAAGSEFLGVPFTTALPPRPTSSSGRPSPAPSSSSNMKQPANPNATPRDKLESLSHKYHGELLPLCQDFIARPPADAAKRDFEHKRLTETVLAQVLLKLDAVDTSGDEGARARRKELVRECNAMLTRLDRVVKPMA